MASYKRKKKLIKPKFQLKVAMACFGLALMSVLTMMILLNEAILDFADKGWVDSAALQNEWVGVLLTKLGIATMIFAPMTLALGIILMHRVAGPLYRFEQFLGAVVRGEHEQECRIRKGDELVEFCELLNRLTVPLRDGTVDLAPFQAAMANGPLPAELGIEVVTPATDEAPVEETERVEIEAA